jgi:hypothetical protein
VFEREISKEDLRQALATGKIIESYPDDEPYPRRLVLGWSGAQPIPVVVDDNRDENEIIVITVYEPRLDRWEPGLAERTR